MIELVILLTIFIDILFIAIEFRRSYLSPSFFFILYQLIMLCGLIGIIDNQYKQDTLLAYLYFIGNIAFICGCYIVPYNKKVILLNNYDDDISRKEIHLMIFIMLACIIICYLFFYIHGNVFIRSIQHLISKTYENLSWMRKDIRYAKGSGYIYELRVYILPVITFYLIFYSNKFYKIIGLIVLPIVCIFLLSSGQRYGAIIAMIMAIVSLLSVNHYIMKRRIREYKFVFFIFIIIFISFIILTIFNGRTETDTVLYAIYKRLLYDNQFCDIISFRYIIYDSSSPIGEEWSKMLLHFIPWCRDDSYQILATRTFKFLYGTYQGTAPPSIWGSTYYDFGIIGVIFIGFIFGLFCKLLYIQMFKHKLSAYRVHIFAYLFFSVGSWFADSAIHFINDGFIELLFLHYLLKIYHKLKWHYQKCQLCT